MKNKKCGKDKSEYEEPQRRYTMAELLAVSDYTQVQPYEEREWVDTPAVGQELI